MDNPKEKALDKFQSVKRPQKFKRGFKNTERMVGEFLKNVHTPQQSSKYKSEMRHLKKELKREK